MERWQNIQNVVVVGLGITGLSVVKHLVKYQPHTHVKVIAVSYTHLTLPTSV